MPAVVSAGAPRRPLVAVIVAVLAAAWLIPATTAWKIAADLGHSWAVPLLVAYLWWERWEERPPALDRGPLRARWWALAVLLGLALLPLRLLVAPFPLWPALFAVYTGLLIAIALTGSWLVAGRPGVRWTAGPLILILAAVPWPTRIESSLIIPLREHMAALAAEISNWALRPALASGTSIRLGHGWVGIDEACGGIRSLLACTMIGLFFGEWFRLSWLRRAGLLLAGGAAAVVGNFTRVLFLALRTDTQQVERLHDVAGWIAMGLSLVLTAWIACHWGGYRWPAQRRLARTAGNGSAGWAWLGVAAALIAADEIATRAWYAYGEAQRTGVPQWETVLPVRDPGFQAEPLPESARTLLRPDVYSAGRWDAGPGLSAAAYYVEWRHGQVARSVPFLHNPTVCLPLSGCELVDTLPPISFRWEGGEVPFFAYKFRRVGQDYLVAFTIWDPARGALLAKPDTAGSWAHWWSGQWAEVREARLNQPAQLLSVMIPWRGGTGRAQMESVLRSIIFPVSTPPSY